MRKKISSKDRSSLYRSIASRMRIMNNSFINTVLIALVLLVSTGCEHQSSVEEDSVKDTSAVTLRLGHDSGEASAQHIAAVFFSDLVKQKTDGQVIVEIFPAQSLGTDHQMIEMARKGELDIILPPTAKLSALTPQLQLIDIPFLFNSRKEAYRVLDGAIGASLLEKLAESGLIGFSFWESGFKQITSNSPIHSLGELSGMKFRIMRSEILQDQFRSWGAKTIPIEFSKTKQALADKVIDGQENPLGSIYNMGFHEVQNELILSNHGYLSQILAVSGKTYNKLPENIRTILRESASEATHYQRQLAHDLDNVFLQKIKESTITVSEIDPELRSQLKSRSKQVLEKYRMTVGTEIIENTLQALDEIRGYQQDGLIIALDADMAGNSSMSGLAIRRGIEIGIAEVNAAGGVLGKRLELVVRDNSMVSARGVDNLYKFSEIPNLVAVFGGISSPVALSQIDLIHEKEILFLDPWAAATSIVDNGRDPNYVFRLSVRDEYAGAFLLSKALKISNKIAVLLANNGWGRSNHNAINIEIKKRNEKLASVQWFDWGERNLDKKIDDIYASGAEVIIYVGNAVEGSRLVKNISQRGNKLPIISHWGVAGSNFPAMTDGHVNDMDFYVLQTFSFINNENTLSRKIVQKYEELYSVIGPEKIVAPVGTAHAYDLVHLLAKAINVAGNENMQDIRTAMERLKYHKGLVRVYDPPFTSDKHDALDAGDFFLGRYKQNVLVKAGL